jgi:hypothetical protein
MPSWGGIKRPSRTRGKKRSYPPHNDPESKPPTSPLSDDSKNTAIGYGKFSEMGSPPRRKK